MQKCYKHTLQIPQTEFSMKANLHLNSQKYINFWKSNCIYKKRLKKNNLFSKFILHDGPPYANGKIHMGHALNKILKDFIVRYKNMNDFYAEFIPGWDCHGLPIENEIEKNKKYKYQTLTLLEKRKLCREYALEQINIQIEQLKKLHLLTDFEKKYLTLDVQYIFEELKIFLFLIEKELLYWDLKPVSWSYSSRTALAESEIVYLPLEETSIYFCFPITSNSEPELKDARVIVWTTTPYSLEANLTLVFHPNKKYVLFSCDNQKYICNEKLFLDLVEKLELKNSKVIKEYLGKNFENLEYKNTITDEIHKIVIDEFVTDDSGSGIVHMAPAYGMDDYKVAKKYKIPIYCSINDAGYFLEKTKFTPINNIFYRNASEIIIEHLSNVGCLLKKEKITHNIGHDWRTKKPTLYRATKQWFLNIEKIQKQLPIFFENINSFPVNLKNNLINVITQRSEWCLSRQRCWGVPIPIIFENDMPILDSNQIKHTIELLEKDGIDSWWEKDVDYFLLNKKNNCQYRKSTDVLDVWFDSGTSYRGMELNYGKKPDFYLEGHDQLRGWFNSSSIISSIVTGEPPTKTFVVHGFVLDKHGKKMSKSLGNVVDPIEIVEKYGTDILRLWIAKTSYHEDINFSDESLNLTINQYRKIRNTLFRYSLSVLKNYEFKEETLKKLTYLENQYIYETFISIKEKIFHHFSSLSFYLGIQEVMNFLNLYSGWFLEISKNCLYCDLDENQQKQEVLAIIYFIFYDLLRFFSIFIPQTCEEAYEYLNLPNKEDSIVLEDWIKEDKSSYSIDKNFWNYFFLLREKIYAKIEVAKNEKIINLIHESNVIISSDLIKDFEILQLQYWLNVAEINVVNDESEKIKIEKTNLPCCLRCKRYVQLFNKETELCQKCQTTINL